MTVVFATYTYLFIVRGTVDGASRLPSLSAILLLVVYAIYVTLSPHCSLTIFDRDIRIVACDDNECSGSDFHNVFMQK
jgi:hypothetical protein